MRHVVNTETKKQTPELSMREHASRVAQAYYFNLRRLRSVRRQLYRDVSARLVSALVLSRLDYCNAVLVGGDTGTIAESSVRGGETRARPGTTRPCNSRRTTPETCSRWSPTFYHALNCAPAATATSSNQEPSGELVTVHSLSPYLVHGIADRQN